MARNTRAGQNANDGESQLELLLFDLFGDQLFGLNVFRVSEASFCPKLSQLPGLSPYVIGSAYLRGRNIPVIDLSKAIACRNKAALSKSSVIVCESNKRMYGFLVQNIRQIISLPWHEVKPPPPMLEESCCVSSIVQLEGKKTVQVIDVERVLEIVDPQPRGKYDELDWVQKDELKGVQVLVVEDSKVACRHLTEFLDYIGVRYTVAVNGAEAIAVIKEWKNPAEPLLDRLYAIISDIEMPVMDGISLVKELRKDHRLDRVAFYFHSTLGRLLNHRMIHGVEVNAMIEKGDYKTLLAELKAHRHPHGERKMIA